MPIVDMNTLYTFARPSKSVDNLLMIIEQEKLKQS